MTLSLSSAVSLALLAAMLSVVNGGRTGALQPGGLAYCTGTANSHPIETRRPTFVRAVPNGKLFVVDTVDPPINVVHLYGTAFAMGAAQGALLGPSMKEFIALALQYAAEQIPARCVAPPCSPPSSSCA